jgi:hypothetical protein
LIGSWGGWRNQYISSQIPQGLPNEDTKKEALSQQIGNPITLPSNALPPLGVPLPVPANAKPITIDFMIHDGKIGVPMLVSSTGNALLDRAV